MHPRTRALDGLVHLLRGFPGQGGEGGGERLPVRVGGKTRHGHGRRHRVGGVVEGRALRRAAVHVAAQVRPVPAVLDPQQVAQPQPVTPHRGGQCVRDRGGEPPRAITDADDGAGPLFGEHRHGVVGDVGRHRGVWRVRQVIAEADLHLLARARGTDDHEAERRVETQQVGHDRQYASGGANPDPGLRPVRVRRRPGFPPGWRRAQLISHRGGRGWALAGRGSPPGWQSLAGGGRAGLVMGAGNWIA